MRNPCFHVLEFSDKARAFDAKAAVFRRIKDPRGTHIGTCPHCGQRTLWKNSTGYKKLIQVWKKRNRSGWAFCGTCWSSFPVNPLCRKGVHPLFYYEEWQKRVRWPLSDTGQELPLFRKLSLCSGWDSLPAEICLRGKVIFEPSIYEFTQEMMHPKGTTRLGLFLQKMTIPHRKQPGLVFPAFRVPGYLGGFFIVVETGFFLVRLHTYLTGDLRVSKSLSQPLRVFLRTERGPFCEFPSIEEASRYCMETHVDRPLTSRGTVCFSVMDSLTPTEAEQMNSLQMPFLEQFFAGKKGNRYLNP